MRKTVIIKNPIKRRLFFVLGWINFILGFIGAILPIVPTTPFLLLAAYFFSKSSPKLYHYLISLPKVGKPVEDYLVKGVIDKKSKVMCFFIILAVCIYISLLLKVPIFIKVIAVSSLVFVLSFVLTRPSESIKSQ